MPKLCKKNGDRWCGKFVTNFGWHYAIILADLLGMWFEDPAWHHDSDLVVSWNCHRTSKELARNWSDSISSPVSGQLGCQLECRVIYVKRSGQNCGIMLAGTAPYCTGHVILFRRQNTLCHITYWLVLAGTIMKITLANFWSPDFRIHFGIIVAS